ncbi:hypothetical protein [Variovorax sp. DAIF25]|uniref:hypothetical protein n=1 Tax=Variovorax sp. DAIF25 TaxID=3080983 RepID=UPI003D6AF552
MSKPPEKTKGMRGRKELLTEDLARRIALMIEQFPDAHIAVTWENVIAQVKRRFGHEFHRNPLSQKTWDGRKIIAEAYNEAKDVQRRLLKETAPKYADNPRSRLREIIAKLQAENLALREQLNKVRAQQYDELYSLLDLRTPLHQVVASRHAHKPDLDKTEGLEQTGDTVVSLADAKATRTPSKNP